MGCHAVPQTSKPAIEYQQTSKLLMIHANTSTYLCELQQVIVEIVIRERLQDAGGKFADFTVGEV